MSDQFWHDVLQLTLVPAAVGLASVSFLSQFGAGVASVVLLWFIFLTLWAQAISHE